MSYELTREFTFHAAHSLTSLPGSHKCSHMHGHTYRVLFTITGDLNPEKGWVMDFGEMADAAQEVHDLLDHKYLNEIEGLDVPTSENIARFIYNKLWSKLTRLVSVTVYETPTSSCTYSPFDYGVRVTLGPRRFSAVHMVLNEDFEEPMHGHDFILHVEFYSPYGQALKVKEALNAFLDDLIKTFDHKTILPGEPETGDLEQTPDKVEFAWKGRRIVLKPEDVKILGEEEHSTTECIGHNIATEIKIFQYEHEFDMDVIRVHFQENEGNVVTVELTEV